MPAAILVLESDQEVRFLDWLLGTSPDPAGETLRIRLTQSMAADRCCSCGSVRRRHLRFDHVPYVIGGVTHHFDGSPCSTGPACSCGDPTDDDYHHRTDGPCVSLTRVDL